MGMSGVELWVAQSVVHTLVWQSGSLALWEALLLSRHTEYGVQLLHTPYIKFTQENKTLLTLLTLLILLTLATW